MAPADATSTGACFLLFDSELINQNWVLLAITSGLWVPLPLAVGLRLGILLVGGGAILLAVTG